MKEDLRQWAKEKYFTKNKKIKGDYFMRTNAEKMVSKIYKLLILLLIVSMSFTGCMITNTGEGLESGFAFSSLGGESCQSNPFHCGYKTDRTEFDIDDVTIDLYYGVECCNDDGLLCAGVSIPTFDIYVEPRGTYNKYLIKHVEEELFSVKYNCKVISKDFLIWPTIKIIYNHHEAIKIPKEAFENGSGRLDIIIYGTFVSGVNSREGEIVGTVIYYKVIGEKVMLSKKSFNNS
jgi:hypothetical protein